MPHCPDFLQRLVALIHSMRLSLMKGAHADLSSTAWQEIGVKPLLGLSGTRNTQRNYLSVIAAPFSFILFYEVLTLIAALPTSTTQSNIAITLARRRTF